MHQTATLAVFSYFPQASHMRGLSDGRAIFNETRAATSLRRSAPYVCLFAWDYNRLCVCLPSHSSGTFGNPNPAHNTHGTLGTPLCRYYFVVGSVDAFERKLDAAQRELGIPSDAFVPVK